uniref:Uncharacterized protein n=1 Tax=Rhizophora mucronata TaxID=61149 RepID=A0A2P2JYQ9_RHIMU
MIDKEYLILISEKWRLSFQHCKSYFSSIFVSLYSAQFFMCSFD